MSAAEDWRRPTVPEADAIRRSGLEPLRCIIIGDGVHSVEMSPLDGRQWVPEEPDRRLSEIMPE